MINTESKIMIVSSMNNRSCFPHMSLSSKIYAFFLENGYNIVRDIYTADYVIINTCAFDDFSEEESIAAIEKIHTQYSINSNKIIVVGCLPDISGENKWKEKITIISDRNIGNFDILFEHNISILSVKPVNYKGSIESDKIDNNNSTYYDADKQIEQDCFYIEISKGCDFHCTYCSIKKVKGSPKSKTIQEIKFEIQRGLYLGYNDFYFVSDDCGSYGKDIETNIALLINETLGNFQDITLHLNYLEPSRFLLYSDQIDMSLKDRILSINIPVQSTSKEILDTMKRYYDPNEIFQKINEWRRLYKKTKFYNQMIYAFPGETQEEFKESLKVIDIYDSSSFFCFSPKKNTVAATYPLIKDIDIYKRTVVLYKLAQDKFFSTKIYLGPSKYLDIIHK